jgi:hypothetical protein
VAHWTHSELQETISEVARLCAVDPKFRSLALRDSAAAIAQVNRKPLPHDFRVRFVDNSGLEKIVPLPDLVPAAEDELSESSLASVSGGGDPPPPPVTISGGWSKLARHRKSS